ncbi:hypothetical protein BDV59DRAFT_170150 [Aspergillus ambiguus]|uniref:uncharacterized protein n=1 Tax=Aspergillus ambiguus TaxID=176160 RepID=UPI003CCD9F08
MVHHWIWGPSRTAFLLSPSTLIFASPPVLSNRNPPIPPVPFSLAANSLLFPNRPRSGWEDENLREGGGWPESGPALAIPSTRTLSRTAVARRLGILSGSGFPVTLREGCNCKRGSSENI